MLEYSEETGRRIWDILNAHQFQVYATDYHFSMIAFHENWRKPVGQVVIAHSTIIICRPKDPLPHKSDIEYGKHLGWHWSDAFYASFAGLGAMLSQCIKHKTHLAEERPTNVPVYIVEHPIEETFYIDLGLSYEDPMPAALLELYGVRDFRLGRDSNPIGAS